ncbi:hypothetical protein GCK72_025887 [Caenorhabditis remanei]|uniref:Uncharacterized protein n=1 Tax=Caenorhabditis remanei TaxID=31234 RepID=A0A6A5G4K6_CAERE|nr:hypothetical protein GCK72_025887 [Caenorhabditis remanei]KAF1749419.1 hypothetical protein GCK72_025887 [Caenorhabditis remanei]
MDTYSHNTLVDNMCRHGEFFRSDFKTPSKHRRDSTHVIHLSSDNDASPMRAMSKKVSQSTKKLLTKVTNVAHRLLTPFKKARRNDSVDHAAVQYTPNDMDGHQQMRTDFMDPAGALYCPDVMEYNQQVVDTQCYDEVLGGESTQAKDDEICQKMSSPMQIFSRIDPSEETFENIVEELSSSVLIYHPNDSKWNEKEVVAAQSDTEVLDVKTTHAKDVLGLSNDETRYDMPMQIFSRIVPSESEHRVEGPSTLMRIFQTANDMTPTKSPMPTISRLVLNKKTPAKCDEGPSSSMLISGTAYASQDNTHVITVEMTPTKSDNKHGVLQWSSATLALHSPVVAPKYVPGPSNVAAINIIPPVLHLSSPTPLQNTPEKDDGCSPIVSDSTPTKDYKRDFKVVPEKKKGRNLLSILETQKNDFKKNETSSPSASKKNAAEESTDLSLLLTPSESAPIKFPGEESDDASVMLAERDDKCSGGILSAKQSDQLLSFLKNMGSNVKNGFSSIKKGRESEEPASTSQTMPPVNTFKETTAIEAHGTVRADQKARNPKLGKHTQLLKVKKVEPRKPRASKPNSVEERDPLSYLQRSRLVSEHESLKVILPLLPKPEDCVEFDIYEEMPPRRPLPISPLAVKSYPVSVLPPWVEKTAKRNLQKVLLAEGPAGTSSTPSTYSADRDSHNASDKEPEVLTEAYTDVDATNKK